MNLSSEEMRKLLDDLLDCLGDEYICARRYVKSNNKKVARIAQDTIDRIVPIYERASAMLDQGNE